MSFWVLCVSVVVVWFFAVLFFVLVDDTLVFVSLPLSYGGLAIKTKRIDDRQSFKRARLRQKKKAVKTHVDTKTSPSACDMLR